jgi:hypothetical protein
MTKEQVREEIQTLNPFEVIKHLGLDSNETQRMMDGVGYRYSFDVEEDRIGFIEWNRDIGDFSSYSVPRALHKMIK